MSHQPQVVIVTGAAGNVGRALTASLATRGDHVVAIDRLPGAISGVLAPFGGDARHLALPGVDLTDAEACGHAVETVLKRFGRLDGVAHTVGGFVFAMAAEGDAKLWDGMFRLNVLTTLNIFTAALPPMRAAGRGSLVAIGATAGIKTGAGLSAYAAAKSGVHRMVESFADELKSQHIRVNAILPSIIDTPLNREAMPAADHSAWVTADEVAEAMAFLVSGKAGGITGALIPVTGRV